MHTPETDLPAAVPPRGAGPEPAAQALRRRARGKLIALILGAIALAVAVPIAWRWGREEYLLAKLRSGSEEEQKAAARELVRMRVGRAAAVLAKKAVKLKQRHDAEEGYENLDSGAAFFSWLPSQMEDEEWEQNWAIQALTNLGKAALSPLVRDLQADPSVEVFIGLASLGEDARPAIPALLERLSHPTSSVRENAILALWEVQPFDADALNHLRRCLRDESSAVRQYAAGILARWAPDSKAAAPELVKLLADPDEAVVSAAVEALVELRAELPRVLAVIQARAAVATEDSAFDLRSIADWLGRIGTEAAPAAGILRGAMKGNVPRTSIAAACALIGIVGPDAEAMECIRKHLVGQELVLCLHSLVAAGPAAKSLVPEIEKHLVSWQTEHQVAAARALWSITKDVSRVLPVLILIVAGKMGETDDQVATIYVLGEIGPPAREAVPVLETALASPSRSLRRAAAAALKKIRAQGHP